MQSLQIFNVDLLMILHQDSQLSMLSMVTGFSSQIIVQYSLTKKMRRTLKEIAAGENQVRHT